MGRKCIATEEFSNNLRVKVFNSEDDKFLITNFKGTQQEKDLSLPANCDGFGRIHHFRRLTAPNWIPDPIPIDPVLKKLSIADRNLLHAQVFQLAGCNWRCWYCFVDYESLSASPKYSSWLSTDELIEKYIREKDAPKVIDLSGGYPDIAPEWVPSFMRSLIKYGLDKSTYLWSDDNLSTDFFWRFLNVRDLELIKEYSNYSKVGCLKGFNEVSFSYNTNASPELFDNQFQLMGRFLELGLDMYAYAIFTTPSTCNLISEMAKFIDKLQVLHPNFPLRVVPLEIKRFNTNAKRLAKTPDEVIRNQYKVVSAWMDELTKRFSSEELNICISDVNIK